jgi:pyruvate carboxylase
VFSKILVANRGEIAIRAFRAAYELGAQTVAVYPYEDRNSLHRLKADEAYLIGERGHPVRAYLDVSEIVRVALESGADAIYPGYGFLSENPELAAAAAANGITFIGPGEHVLEMAGNKVTAKEHAIAAGVPVLASTPASRDIDELIAGADAIGFPVFAKAVAGGGGRGMRRVETKPELRAALEEAMREADSAFGDPTMFLEQAVIRPRHIEVQILADATGTDAGTIHLFERDCSVQRRNQKVVEIAPAPNLDPSIAQALHRDAVAFARSIGYVNAGTVEFLLDTEGERAGQHVFIEMNPRIQVEHTVTEEVTDVDLVQSQMRIAAGQTLGDLGLSQDTVSVHGAALQTRITTEDPTQGFRPDTGRITTYRSPGGAGVRLDGGTVATGAQISPHFDSMLAKMTCRGRDFPAAVARAKRALATRVRTKDLVAVAPHVARLTPQLLSVEAWGGATYDVALRFLGEDPWERLASLREAMPNIPIQMLLRGRNTVGYTPYPTEVTDAFVAEAAATGVDVFRVFDALNDVSQLRPALEAVLATDTAVAEAALCYTADLLDPAEDLYTLDYYLRLAEQMVEAGAHVIGIKDMAGLLRAGAAEKLVTALRERFDQPVHVHTHDTAGGQLATLLAAARAGADAVDVAAAPMAGTTSQPSMSALVAALAHTERDTGISLTAVGDLEPYWEAVRRAYAPFESGLPGPTGRVYQHEIPGGQLSNLRQQAIALGLGDRFEQVEDWYAAANRILGRPTKVTPSSKVVGDLALQLAAVNADPVDFEQNPQKYDIPDSVIGFMAGELGDLPGGWPEPFRSKVLEGRDVRLEITPVPDAERANLTTAGPERRSALNRLLFPQPTKQFESVREQYGDLSVLPTVDYLYGLRPGQEHTVPLGKGVNLFVGLEAIGEADDRGVRTVMATMNGQLRPVYVRDRSIEVETKAAEKADQSDPKHVAAPFSGVVTLKVAVGDVVEAGQAVASIEAMKMEAAITAPVSGTVGRLAIPATQQVDAGDLLVVLQ